LVALPQVFSFCVVQFPKEGYCFFAHRSTDLNPFDSSMFLENRLERRVLEFLGYLLQDIREKLGIPLDLFRFVCNILVFEIQYLHWENKRLRRSPHVTLALLWLVQGLCNYV